MTFEAARRRAVARTVLVALLVVVAATVGEVFEEVELPTIDARLRVRGATTPDPDVVLVAIDGPTLERIGEPYPFRLATHAALLESLAAVSPAVVVLDVPFGPGGDAPGTDGFVVALGQHEAVTLATSQTLPDGTPVVLGGREALAVPGVRAGDARLDPDDDGVVRRFDHTLDDEDQSVPAAVPGLPVVAAEQATGVTVPPTATGAEGATIAYPGPAGTVPAVSYLSVLERTEAVERLRGRIVVVGPTAPQLLDVFPTPLSERSSRAEIHAAAIATVLDDLPLTVPSLPVTVLLVALVCLVPLGAARLGAAAGALLVLGTAGAWVVLAQLAVWAGLLLPVVAPLAGLLLAVAAIGAVNAVFAARARERVREVFGRYVPDEVVRDLLDTEDDSGDLLRATTREVSVVFTDLRGSTALAEGRDPREVVAVLNAYLGVVTDALLDEGGTALGYLGDGTISVFGAPEEACDHADRALAAAQGVLAATARFNVDHAALLDGDRLRTGVGVNTGLVTAGNLGTVRRLEYTVIGDTVNTASRIEALTKDEGVELLVAAATVERLTGPVEGLREHATLPVRGRAAPITVWSLADTGPPAGGVVDRGG